MKKIIPFITVITTLFSGLLFSYPIYADIDCDDDTIPQSVKDAAGCNGSSNELPNAIITILNGIIAVLGFVAVIFVVVGGINYMTSAGDSNKTKKAKDTILYAVIGLIVCALAFAIVNFVIAKILP